MPMQESDLERELSTRLGELVACPATPSSVDAAGARRLGARRLRRRRAAAAGGAAAVAAALTAGVLGLSPGGTTAGPSGQTPLSAHDPVIARGDFGWLPSTLTNFEYVTGEEGATTRASGKDPRVLGWLTVYAEGVNPPVGKNGGGDALHTERGPRINGVASNWVVDANGVAKSDALALRWKTPSGRWAEVESRGLPLKSRQEVMLKMAEHAVVHERSVPLPFYVTGLPAGAVFRDGGYGPGTHAAGNDWAASASYRLKGSQSYVMWSVRPDQGKPPAPARGSKETCVTRDTLDLCVSGTGATLAAFGGNQGLLDRITLLGPDRSNWTTDVER